MKIAPFCFVATLAHRPMMYNDDDISVFVAQRNSRTRDFADQLHTIVPDVNFGDVDDQIAETMKMLAPLPKKERIDMAIELDRFFNSILVNELLADFDP